MREYSLTAIFRRFKLKIIFTIILVILELAATLFFPLIIGYAINDLLVGVYNGLFMLVILIVIAIIIGASRRLFDSRVYANIYRKISLELISDEEKKGNSTSVITARVNLLTELVKFFENSFPEIVSSFLGIIGILIIISAISYKILLLCLGAVVGIVIVYGISSKRNWILNKKYNDQTEYLVSTIESADKMNQEAYFKRLMSINIKLSDLEMVNYSIVTSIAMSVFILSMLISVGDGEMEYGIIFSILMYVFDFVEKSIVLPLYYQNFIRLQEISQRLSAVSEII